MISLSSGLLNRNPIGPEVDMNDDNKLTIKDLDEIIYRFQLIKLKFNSLFYVYQLQ